MTNHWIGPCLVVGLLMLIVGGHAQQQRQQPPDPLPGSRQENTPAQSTDQELEQEIEVDQPIPIFRTGINFIRVDVIVTDGDGNPVTDLTVDDFEIYEDDNPQAVDSFQLVEISAVPAPDAEPVSPVFDRNDQEQEAQRADVRVFVIFLDDYHVREGNGIRASRMLAEFIENQLVPTDLVGVMYPLMPLDDVRLTRNRQATINALNQFRGVKYDYRVRNEFEARYNDYPTETVERIRNDVSLSALRGLMIRLGGLREGRKHVVLVSEGYSNYVPPQLRSMNASIRPTIDENPQRLDRFAANDPLEEASQFFDGASIMLDLRRIFQTANRFNTAFYPVDPRGLATFEFDVDQPTIDFRTDSRILRQAQDTLRVLAEETDGRAIVNQNNLAPGLRQMLRDASAYYLLGYNSSEAATDGQYHEINVRVKREGVQVRARKGFWAVTERDAVRALTTAAFEPPKAVEVALSALAEPRRGRLVRTWLGTSRAENGKTRVTFVWEPVQQGRGRGDTASRVLVTAMGDTGAFFRGRVPERVSSAGRGTSGGLIQSGPPPVTRIDFEADSGTMQISLAIESDGGAVLDRDRNEVEIPDFTGSDILLSTPWFVRARNALEFRSLVEDWDAPPTAAREFRRTDRLLLRFETYVPGTATPDIKARLLNRGGDPMYPLDLQLATNGAPHQVDIVPVSLPPGEYVIELTATAAGSEATELIAFRLTT